jgi:hypothetical protein
MRWVVRVFAAIGLLATIGTLLVGLSFTGIGVSRSSHDYIFNWGGLDPHQHYTVVWDGSDAPSRDGPFEVICFQLEDGGFAPRDPTRWSWQANDAWEAKVRDDALPGESALGCIPDDEIRSNSTGMLLWHMEYFGSNASGATAIFYHRPTMRLLFVNWAT